MKKIFLLVCVVFIAFSTNATSKKKQKKQAKKTEVANAVKQVDKSNTMRLCDTPNPQPVWFLELPKGFTFPPNFRKPSAYRIVSTIDTVFTSFLKGIPYEKSVTKIVLPLFINNSIECKEFIISRTETMDSALQAKYPQLMSFKAFAATNSLNAARINCDGVSTNMEVTFDKKIYFITCVQFNKMNYYICYAKDDPNFVKEKFER